MEDQGVQSPQTFLVKKFFLLQPSRKHEDRSTLQVLTTDRGFKAAFQTLETKMVM